MLHGGTLTGCESSDARADFRSGRVYCRWFRSISSRARASCSAPGAARTPRAARAASSAFSARCSSPTPGVVEAGHVARRPRALLEDAGIDVVAVHGLRREPRQRDGRGGTPFAAAARRRLRSSRLGGGSSLDCAKGINFVLTNGGSIADYRGYGKATHAAAADDRHPHDRRHGKRGPELRGDFRRGDAHEDGLRRSRRRPCGSRFSIPS